MPIYTITTREIYHLEPTAKGSEPFLKKYSDPDLAWLLAAAARYQHLHRVHRSIAAIVNDLVGDGVDPPVAAA